MTVDLKTVIDTTAAAVAGDASAAKATVRANSERSVSPKSTSASVTDW
jgi:hypothetical protein